MRNLTLLLLGFSMLVAPLGAQESIGTTDAWDGLSSAPLLTRDFYASAVGQTFLAPSYDARITGFSFYMGYFPYFPPFDQDTQFYAYLMGWDGVAPTDLLYRSPIQPGETGTTLVRRDFQISTPLFLSPGSQYLAFLSTLEADPFLGYLAYQNVGLVATDPYAQGMLVQHMAPDFATLTSTPWMPDATADLAFEARFQPTGTVPEPGSGLLLATGLLGLAGVLWCRRRPTAGL